MCIKRSIVKKSTESYGQLATSVCIVQRFSVNLFQEWVGKNMWGCLVPLHSERAGMDHFCFTVIGMGTLTWRRIVELY